MVFLATVARILGLFLVSVSIAPVSTAYKCKTISFQLDRPKNRLIAANPKDDVPVSYTLIKGRPGRAAGQPAVFLLNGFNVGSEWYSQLCEKLCGKGLTIVTVQDKRTRSIVIPGLPRPGCDGNYTYISGGYLSIVYEANATNLTLTPNAREAVGYFQKAARKNGVMFLAHSQGGAFGADIMNSTCDMPPGRGTARCDGYAPMVDSKGDDLIKAAVMYEGYSSGIYGIQLKPNRVTAYAAGQFNNATEQAYVNTTGCKIFARLKHANHYGLTNYVPGINGSQITPCARQAISDPASYQVTKSIQKQNVALFSDMALAVARAFRGGELHRAKLDVKSLQTKVTDLRQSCN